SPPQPMPRSPLASIAAPTSGMKQRKMLAPWNSNPPIMTPASLQRSAQWPTSGRTITLIAERGEHHADDKGRAAELGHVKRQDRVEHRMLRVAQKLRRAEQEKGPRPDGI